MSSLPPQLEAFGGKEVLLFFHVCKEQSLLSKHAEQVPVLWRTQRDPSRLKGCEGSGENWGGVSW